MSDVTYGMASGPRNRSSMKRLSSARACEMRASPPSMPSARDTLTTFPGNSTAVNLVPTASGVGFIAKDKEIPRLYAEKAML